ncbi:AbrB/MazE/SpoVT family DNA-binding domain-containing protein [Pelomicrobium methylotrophicum]|uniref:AbrB/MazE/SpoVT family DNA-binding domain-containing protein n=1 Tax=Pelomicrobium methylotrophicum TaxID=2602750 RepID=A0A5C7EEN3_9PROT|nr:AbrB/MazE/SpoVT family DNA-binding domain-containing protein [Pelomicrobium methylotrophicum]TXF10634.1 AbrB/MazE/SpoVT family DNA-binding domain-containing protein [Pelomicrobium methylotrophicum]
MRITPKGQVTIPIEIRRQAGLLPDTEVEFEIRGCEVVIKKARGPKSRGERLIERMRRVKPTIDMTTDEIMAHTRGSE